MGEFVTPDRIFGPEYPYFSSVSHSWLVHAGQYAENVSHELSLTPRDLVIEIASNDGYLLERMQRLGATVLGVEPATNVSDAARARDVPTIPDFFGLHLAQRLVKEHGHPRLVIANNVLAHVPDLDDFVAGLAHLCDDGTVVTIENPRFVTLLRETQFDTIYHEHFSYLSAHTVSALVRRHGLDLFRVDSLPTHGGSNRYWLSRGRTRETEPSVGATVRAELEGGLLDPGLWEDFRLRSVGAIAGLRSWLDAARNENDSVAAYGAAAKGATLLNAAAATVDDVMLVVDNNDHKKGKYIPGCKLPIVSSTELERALPDHVLVLPWNIADELLPLVRSAAPQATCWTALPGMRRLG